MVQWMMPALSVRYCTWPALAFFTAVVTSMVTVPTFGFGIRPRGTEDLAEGADHLHGVRRGDHDVEVHVAGLDVGGQIVEADDVGAGGLGRLGLFALGEHGDTNGLAGTGRQHDRAAHQLVGLLGIDAQIDGNVDRLVELGGRAFLDQAQRIADRIGLVAVDLGQDGFYALGFFAMIRVPPR
jgi:hypothetical protein